MSETILHNDMLNVTRYTGPGLGLVGEAAERAGMYQITDAVTGMLLTLSAEQWESLRAVLYARAVHPGIELRISNLSGELTRANSDELHYAAKYGYPGGSGDWQELLPGVDWPADTPLPARLKIEIRPVTLGGDVGDVAAEAADAQGAEGAQAADPPAVDVADVAAEGPLM